MRKVLAAVSVIAALALGGVALAQHGAHSIDRLMQHDADGDGNLSREEFNAAHATLFEHMDANRDGRLTRDEIEAAHRRHQSAH